jgi:hypothetical protein
MNLSFFSRTACLFGLSLWAIFACKNPAHPCVQSLRERDGALSQRADSLIFQQKKMTFEPYRAELEKLRVEEKQLFAEAENCDFGKDLQAWNYWHRGRLKFPSKIELELRRLERDSI